MELQYLLKFGGRDRRSNDATLRNLSNSTPFLVVSGTTGKVTMLSSDNE